MLFGPRPDEPLKQAQSETDSLDGERQTRARHGPTFDVNDDDVRRIFPRVVAHRLRVLDGPAQEITASLIFGAAGASGDDAKWATGRRTVREILKEILDTV